MGSQTNEYPLSDSNEAAAPTRMIRDSGASFLLEMPVEEWIAMPGHPRQRDTDRHSKKSHWKRVRKLTGAAAEAQRQVIAAELDGKLIKVDGHTRAHLWSTGYLKRPDTVLVNVYRCSSLTELIRLYSIFDSQDAVEKQQDRVSGAMRQYHVKLTSKRLFQGAFTDSLSIACRGIARGTVTLRFRCRCRPRTPPPARSSRFHDCSWLPLPPGRLSRHASTADTP